MSSNQLSGKSCRRHVEVVKNAWRNLVVANTIDRASLRDEIALSWERCMRRNVSPYASSSVIQRRASDLSDSDVILKLIAEPYMHSVHEHLSGQGFIVALTSAQGEILHVLGDRVMRNVAEKASVVPGGSFLENILGTTSPGICIEKKIPIQVLKFEHYCDLFHSWCCTAVPIFDQSGNFVGTLDVSNLNRDTHPAYLLDFLSMTARTIGLELSYRVLQGDFKKACHYIRDLFGGSDDGPGRAGDAPPPYEPAPPANPARVRFRAYDVAPARAMRDVSPEIGTGDECGIVRYTFDDFVHDNAVMRDVVREAQRLAASDISIFIGGESGTGKEVFAQAIHAASPRRRRPFVAVNCASLPTELIQSELFGYVEGAFTGARRKGQAGKFELAHGGTLFLDEIGDMPLDVQANLLRVLQEKYIVRIGGSQPVPVDVRVLSATNKDLSAEVEAGRFRQDLYYRLVVFDLVIPPLRERRDDIWPLIEHFSRKMLPNCHYSVLTFADDARRLLERHDWPGNVRELENAVLYMMTKTSTGQVRVAHLPRNLARSAPVPFSIKDSQDSLMRSVLRSNNNNISKAAKLLGVSRSTLYRRMKKTAEDA